MNLSVSIRFIFYHLFFNYWATDCTSKHVEKSSKSFSEETSSWLLLPVLLFSISAFLAGYFPWSVTKVTLLSADSAFSNIFGRRHDSFIFMLWYGLDKRHLFWKEVNKRQCPPPQTLHGCHLCVCKHAYTHNAGMSLVTDDVPCHLYMLQWTHAPPACTCIHIFVKKVTMCIQFINNTRGQRLNIPAVSVSCSAVHVLNITWELLCTCEETSSAHYVWIVWSL